MRQRASIVCALWLVAGCGRIGYDVASDASADGALDADLDAPIVLSDASIDAAGDAPTAPLDAPVDAAPDARLDVGCAVEAPALLAPANGALTGTFRASSRGTLRPTFRWLPGCAETYELEVDDSCPASFGGCTFPSPELSMRDLVGTSARPPSDLPVSTSAPVGRRYYWRLRACAAGACGPWSAVRYLDVGREESDVNGDGYADLVVGALQQDAGALNEGNAFVYLGGPTGVPTTPSTTLDNPANQASGLFGQSVASAGDVNGDGYADLVVGAYSQDAGAPQEGNAFVYLGPRRSALDTEHPDRQPRRPGERRVRQ
jgi:hypothetical protein